MGYRYAAEHPSQAADLLISANKSVLTNTKLVQESEALLAKDYYKGTDGSIGTQSAERWQAFADFEYKAGLLVDANGKKLTSAPKASTYFTNAYLPDAK
ncbi:hypothetical protein [Streptomyces sp. NPDC050548]|uniref:hypothetical protein n=1 Tax=Streptomyces sp. NPDC050548 TaxID=3365629 RepID=UPI0037BC55B2